MSLEMKNMIGIPGFIYILSSLLISIGVWIQTNSYSNGMITFGLFLIFYSAGYRISEIEKYD